MMKETWDLLDAEFDPFPRLRGKPVSRDKVYDAVREIGGVPDEDYISFVERYGGGIVGPYRVYGVEPHLASGLGQVLAEENALMRRGLGKEIEGYMVVSADHAGSPFCIWQDGSVWLFDIEFGGRFFVARCFEEFLRKRCIETASAEFLRESGFRTLEDDRSWDEVIQRLDAYFALYPYARGLLSEGEEATTEFLELWDNVLPMYQEFSERYGCSKVGSNLIWSLRSRPRLRSPIAEWPRNGTDRLGQISDSRFLMSMDEDANPIVMDRSGRVWLLDDETGDEICLSNSFETFIDRFCLEL